MEAAPVAYAFKDSEAPSVSVTVPAQGSEYVQGSVVPIEFTVDVGNGADLYRADFFDSHGILIDNLKVPTSELGPQTMTYIVSDLAWHEATGSISYTVIPADTTPPTTAAAMPPTPPSGWFTNDVTIEFLTDETVTTHYQIDGGGEQTGTSATVATDGTHTVTYWSVDTAGNPGHAKTTPAFKIDKTAPKITVTKPLDSTPSDLYTVKQKVYSAGSATDGGDPLACSGVATQVITNDGAAKTWGAALNTATAGDPRVQGRRHRRGGQHGHGHGAVQSQCDGRQDTADGDAHKSGVLRRTELSGRRAAVNRFHRR